MLYILGLLLLSGIKAAPPQDILGTWVNEDQTAHIEIVQEGDTYTGKIVWMKTPVNEDGEPWRDGNNPDEALRGRTIMGMQVVTGLRWDDGEYVDGEVYSPQKGAYADCEAELIDANTLELSVSYLRFFSATKTWTRR